MPKVRMEEMLPHELDAAVAACPVAYCAFGSLEWHGQHLPVGNDTLKAHHLLLMTAEKYGGVVVPPLYWGVLDPWKPWTIRGLGQELSDAVYGRIFAGLVEAGFRVVIGVTGHDIPEQRGAVERALAAVKESSGASGLAIMEGDLYDLTEDRMDHAAHWETSLLMYLRPELVDLIQIADVPLATPEEQQAAGIYGRDPRLHASAELGATIAHGIVDSIGSRIPGLLQEAGWGKSG